MNRRLGIVGAVMVAAAMLAAGSISAQEWSDDQKAVWGYVETYWDLVAQKDVDGFLAIFHDDYLGWDFGSPMPAGKASSEKWLKYATENYTWVIYELTPAGIAVIDDVAVVHYYYTGVYTDAEGEKKNTEGRWTDILMKDGDTWMLIGDSGGRDDD